MKLNPTQAHEKVVSHLNWMGGPSYAIDHPIRQLCLAASSCFFGEPMYYHREREALSHTSGLSSSKLNYLRETLEAVDPQAWRDMTPTALMESAIDKALDFNPEQTLQLACELRKTHQIRATPQVIMVRAANHQAVKGTRLISTYAPDIMQRADEPTNQLAYQLAQYGKPIPNSLKRAWCAALERFSDYELTKYRMENRTVKLVDLVRLVHPHGDVFQRLREGTLTLKGRTWESVISEQGSTKQAWLEALDVMPHMALLRNLRNLLQQGIAPELFMPNLLAGVTRGRQLPFRYYAAYQAVRNIAPNSVLADLQVAIEISLRNLPTFSGRTMSLVDNSGSAHHTPISELSQMTVAQIGNLSGVLTAMQSDFGFVGVFGDRLETLQVVPGNPFAATQAVDALGSAIGGSTEHGIWLFWDKAIKEKEHWDHVFVYSDMQAGHGGLYGYGNAYPVFAEDHRSQYIDVPALIKRYRQEVNPNVNVFLVQIAGYQDTLIPEFYNRTFILGGWSDQVLRFASEVINV